MCKVSTIILLDHTPIVVKGTAQDALEFFNQYTGQTNYLTQDRVLKYRFCLCRDEIAYDRLGNPVRTKTMDIGVVYESRLKNA